LATTSGKELDWLLIAQEGGTDRKVRWYINVAAAQYYLLGIVVDGTREELQVGRRVVVLRLEA